MLQDKYTNHKIVLADLGRNFKNMQWDEMDVIEWCQHVENRIVPDVDHMVKYIDHEVEVVNGQAKVPHYAHRVEKYSLTPKARKHVNVLRMDSYIDVHHHLENGKIYVTFVGMPVDENCVPMIVKGHEQLCYWYCVKCAFTEKWLMGEIDHSRWDYITTTVSMMAVEVGQSLRHWTDEDYRKLHLVYGTDIAHLNIGRRNA